MAAKFENVDQYIATFPESTQVLLNHMRTTVQANAPDAEEIISYGMPAYRLGKMLVFFAGYKNHIGFYPSGSGIAAFQDQFTNFQFAKGSVQFPLDKPLPLELIAEMVRFRVQENLELLALKASEKKAQKMKSAKQ